MPRAYRMGERATKLEATRRRIVDAARALLRNEDLTLATPRLGHNP